MRVVGAAAAYHCVGGCQPDVGVTTTRFDLELHVWQEDADLQVVAIYNADLFDSATIGRLLGHYERLLEGIGADPKRAVSVLPLLTEAEHRQLVEWNDTAAEPLGTGLIHELFESCVARAPARRSSTPTTSTVSSTYARAQQLALSS